MPDIYHLQWFLPVQQRVCTFFNLQIFISAALLILLPFPAHSSTAAPPLHEQAIALARSGELSRAVTILEELHQQSPDDKRITADLIVIHGWNRQYSKACQLFEQQQTDTLPAYALTSVLNSYRSLHQAEKALILADRLLQEQEDSVKLLLAAGLLLVDINRLDPARVILNSIETRNGRDSSYFRLSGYIHTRDKKWLDALADYQQLSALLPNDQAAIREQFAALQQSRSEQAASELLHSNEQIFTTHDRAMLLVNQAAERLRWSSDAATDFAETRLLALQALHRQLKAVELLNRDSGSMTLSRHMISDMIITMRNLRQMENVVTVYNYLNETGEPADYVKQAAGAALLATHHPDKSREMYQQILDKDPTSYQANIGLFFSHIEEEDFGSAYQLVDDLFKKEPMFQNFNYKKYRSKNERYLDLDIYTIMARFYGDQLEDSWTGIDRLIRNAPAINWLHEVRGQISNAREWYRQSLYDFHYAGLLEPNSLNARAGEISSLIALRRYGEARPLLEKIIRKYPEEYPAKSIAKEWKVSRKPDYWADVVYGNSSGPELDGDWMTATAEVLSSPIYDNLYLDAFYRYAWAQIIEGEETFKRYAAGPDLHLQDFDLQARITYNDSSLEEIGGRVQLFWIPDDFWHFSLLGERFSVDTPLRALHHLIRADSVAATATYRWSEQRDLNLGIQGSTFTDNNDRLEGTAVFRQRLLDIPHFDLDGRVELYGSTNSRRNTPYFNPEQDFSLLGALHLDHVYFRHYDHLLAQMVDVAYGVYEQKGYGSRWIGHIRYEQRYKFTPWVEMLAGVEYGQNVYDGEAEPYKLVRFMITGKF
jgi:biofilm PGA synthesis protein PgaA